jgi:hypothetical protein
MNGSSSSAWRLPVVLLLAFTFPPLAIVGWILLSGEHRKVYWHSWLVKSGLAIAVIGSLPLLLVIIAAQLGLWPDPNPNPIGFGLLFVFSVVLGSLTALGGVVWTGLQGRRA